MLKWWDKHNILAGGSVLYISIKYTVVHLDLNFDWQIASLFLSFLLQVEIPRRKQLIGWASEEARSRRPWRADSSSSSSSLWHLATLTSSRASAWSPASRETDVTSGPTSSWSWLTTRTWSWVSSIKFLLEKPINSDKVHVSFDKGR